MDTKFKSVLVVSALLCACASNPNKMQAAYVSPLKYRDYDCEQIAMEMDYVSQRTTRLHQSLKKENKKDKWAMGIGLVLFWPALFALEGGDGPEAAEYSQLKGEFEALRTTSTQKKCGYGYSTFEKTVTAYDEAARTQPTNSAKTSSPNRISTLAEIEPADATAPIQLPNTAYKCVAPKEPAPIPRNAIGEDFITSRNKIVEFQRQNGLYQDCLRESVQIASATEGNKQAVIIAHDMSVGVEESVVSGFNLAYETYLEAR
ncbi:hypothetical protein ACFL3I_00445 [Pseudomonadota bacterium]